ncbi:MAG: 6-bladed beta-propeller [Candidatus Aminicenantes bacterium]|nr:6-bladed beta-propeller [Candidatus Aminicenantes bacterium]
MLPRSIIWILCLSLLASSVPAQTIKHVRTIDFDNVKGLKKAQNLLFGGKNAEAIRPSHICRVGKDRYVVIDTIHRTVHLMDSTGRIKRKTEKAGKIRFLSPVSACADRFDNVYVSDSALGVVFMFDTELNFKKTFFAPTYRRITGISYADGTFYLIDTMNHKILRLDHQGNLKNVIGSRGIRAGEFNFPTHLAMDSEHIYVTDAMNFRVQIFDLKGRFIQTFGTNGRGGGNFSKPKGIAVDSKGHIFVADAMFDNVQVFNKKGDFLFYFGGPGQKNGQFWLPSVVIIDENDSIWVADTYNSRIQIFRIEDKVS